MNELLAVPKTDKEVIDQFRSQYPDDMVRACLIGIFRGRRFRGESVHTAYEHALKALFGED